MLLHTEYPIGAPKLRTKFNLNVSEISKVIALPYVTTKDNKLRELQFKLIHNILFTKFKLLKIGKVDSSLCAFCSSDIETIDHLFITCQITVQFWSELFKFIKNEIAINKRNILLGLFNEQEPTISNLAILIGKRVIYKCSLENKIPRLTMAINALRKFMEIDGILNRDLGIWDFF